MRALMEVSDSKGHEAVEESGSVDISMESFGELARDMMSITKDIRTFAFKTKDTVVHNHSLSTSHCSFLFGICIMNLFHNSP